MFCPTGRTTLVDVHDRVERLVGAAYPDERLASAYPSDLARKEDAFRFRRLWITSVVVDELVLDCGSLAITSPAGVTLKASFRLLEATANKESVTRLGLRPYQLAYYFVHPTLFLISNEVWVNAREAGITLNSSAGDGQDLDALARHLESFQGWGLSILDAHVPTDLQALDIYLHGFGLEPDEESQDPRPGRPAKIPAIAREFRRLYPEPSQRPAWKVVLSDLEAAGHSVSEVTARRAWRRLGDQNLESNSE